MLGWTSITSWNFLWLCSIFHDRFGSGPRNLDTTVTLSEFWISALNMVEWYTVPWSRSLCKMVMLSQFLLVPQTFELSYDRLRPGLRDSFKMSAWNLVETFTVPWTSWLKKMPMHGPLLCSIMWASKGCFCFLNGSCFMTKEPQEIEGTCDGCVSSRQRLRLSQSINRHGIDCVGQTPCIVVPE